MIGERIRDKFAASRKKGMWMGGFVPLGYDVKDRKLVVNEAEAATGPHDLRALRADRLGHHAGRRSLRPRASATSAASRSTRATSTSCSTTASTSARPSTRAQPIPASTRRSSTRTLWDKVHGILQDSPRKRAADTRAQTPALLKGLIFGPTGQRDDADPHPKKGGRLYRYYVSMDVIRGRALDAGTAPRRLPAEMVENAVIQRNPATGAHPGDRRADRGGSPPGRAPTSTTAKWWPRCTVSTRCGRPCSRPSRRASSASWSSASRSHRGGDRGRSAHRRPRVDRPRYACSAFHRGGRRMTAGHETIRIVIPLTLRRRNGRPRILPPADIEAAAGAMADPKLLRAIARAWDWRRRLERGEAATLKDIAQSEGVTVPFVSRFLRLAYLSPEILERL